MDCCFSDHENGLWGQSIPLLTLLLLVDSTQNVRLSVSLRTHKQAFSNFHKACCTGPSVGSVFKLRYIC